MANHITEKLEELAILMAGAPRTTSEIPSEVWQAFLQYVPRAELGAAYEAKLGSQQ